MNNKERQAETAAQTPTEAEVPTSSPTCSNTLVIGRAKQGNEFRCHVCGKFISYKDFDNSNVDIDYTPDTQFTVENYKYAHKPCL
jgi:hypothetical protein